MSALASRLRRLPMTASFLVVCGMLVGGGLYLMSFQQRQAYLTSRNFRLLAVLAQQTEDVLNVYSHTPVAGSRVGVSHPIALEPAGQGRNRPNLALDANGGKGPTRPVSDLLAPVFAPKIDQGAFDTLALATTSGKVVLAAGRREWEIGSMELAALLPAASSSRPSAASGTPSSPPFDRISVMDATVAGVAYKMFIQPCCRLLRTADGNGTLVVGLVPAGTFREEAMAISPTVVVIASLLIALLVLAWPFLNVALQSARRPLTYLDALQLGFSGSAGLAIATILVITSVRCAHIERDVEGQLADLAVDLARELALEITGSSEALDGFERWLAACPSGDWGVGYRIQGRCRSNSAEGAPPTLPTGSEYAVAALINKQGQQVRKVWPSPQPPPLVDVSDRAYFHAALRYFGTPALKALLDPERKCTGPPCVLQSVVSYTTGEPSAVLARPTTDPDFPVAALTLPLRSVIKPVLPPGFEFAIIDRTGRVVFHSDVQRNTFEDLFLETDRNPKLRSLVESGINGPVRTEYWGRPYLAHVQHTDAHGWSVVTLFDRRSIRGLMLEWSMVSLVMLALYSVLLIGILAAAMAAGPSWLWPDRFRKRRYAVLGVVYAVILVGFGALVTSPDLPQKRMGLAGFVFPALACLVTFAMLKRKPPAAVGVTHLEYASDYCVPAALLLVITGIVPGSAFVAQSYDAHMEAYVRHRQLGIAQRSIATPTLGTEPVPFPDPEHPRGWHAAFLYNTRLCSTATEVSTFKCENDSATGPELSHQGTIAGLSERVNAAIDDVVSTIGADDDAEAGHIGSSRWSLESFLPYFSDVSVVIRELVHDKADDGSWTSRRDGQEVILEIPANRAGRLGALTVHTDIPQLSGGRTALALLIAALVLLAYGIAFFITRYVLLGQVNAPLSAIGRLAIPEGKVVMLLCDPGVMARRIQGVDRMRLGPLVSCDDRDGQLNDRLRELDRDKVVLIEDLDDGHSAQAAVAAKVELLRAAARLRSHALLVLSNRSLPELEAALQVAESPEATPDNGKSQIDGMTTLDWREQPGATLASMTVRCLPRLRERCRRLLTRGRSTHLTEPAPLHGEAVLKAEERAHADLTSVCTDIRRMDAFRTNRLSGTEVLEELEDRAEPLYLQLWNDCTADEKLELRHIARHGLANYVHRRAVRRLISKRLVKKDPDLRVMNRSFRHFVLSPPHAAHAAELEANAEEGLSISVWDRFRVPIGFAVAAVAIFLFITQRETYNTTIGAVIALSTQVPNMLKAVMTIVQRDPVAPTGQRNG